MQCPHCGRRLSDKLILEMAGTITGNRMAKEKGPAYFRKLQAMRTNRAGGRPPKKK
jgi:hypothetical protein